MSLVPSWLYETHSWLGSAGIAELAIFHPVRAVRSQSRSQKALTVAGWHHRKEIDEQPDQSRVSETEWASYELIG
jgi:hypothetical protein